jgi:hypothetical protein
VVRARDELVRQRVAAINQLTATLDAFWPGAKAIFPDLQREIALAFLERYRPRSRPSTSASSAWPHS